MHNCIDFESLVALLKCVPLHPNQNWSKYAFWSLCFCTDNQVPPEEVLRTLDGQIQRPHTRLVSFSLEPFAGPYVRTVAWM